MQGRREDEREGGGEEWAETVNDKWEVSGAHFSDAIMGFADAILMFGARQNAPHCFTREVQAVCYT